MLKLCKNLACNYVKTAHTSMKANLFVHQLACKSIAEEGGRNGMGQMEGKNGGGVD